MTWDQSIQDLQSQVASLSGKIAQMQQSLGTGWIVMQVKSELAWEYKEIVWYSTTQVNHYQNTFWTILWVVTTVIFGMLWLARYFAKKHIDSILEKVTEKENSIKIIKGAIDQQSNHMFQIQDKLNDQINTVTLIEKNIESQDERIYNNVMQHLVKWWFDRVKEDPKFLDKLVDQLSTFDREIVRLDLKDNYEIIKESGSFDILYHFFADLVFKEGKIKDWISYCEIKKQAHSYSSLIYWLNLIFIEYELDSSLYSSLVEYLKFINKKLFLKKTWVYSKEQLESIKSRIDFLAKKHDIYSTWSEIRDPFIS